MDSIIPKITTTRRRRSGIKKNSKRFPHSFFFIMCVCLFILFCFFFFLSGFFTHFDFPNVYFNPTLHNYIRRCMLCVCVYVRMCQYLCTIVLLKFKRTFRFLSFHSQNDFLMEFLFFILFIYFFFGLRFQLHLHIIPQHINSHHK